MTGHIPPEILAEIFRWVHISALNLFGPDEPVDGGQVFELCWPISGVCKYWRDVAISLPFLWTYLPRITVRDNDDDNSPLSYANSGPLLETLKELISRAQNTTLHPSFICSATTIGGARMGEVAIYLIDRCSQWRSVSISGVIGSIALFFWQIRSHISCLEALRLEFLEEDEPPDEMDVPMFSEASMLKFVHITGGYNWKLGLDTHSLVYLYDGVGGIIHNIYTPNGFPKLTTLEVHDRGFFDFTDEIEDDFTIEFPALKKLVYKCHDAMRSSDEGFLFFPVTPSLEELSITAPEGDVIAHIVSMWDRSGESLPLKHLRILENPLEEGFDGQLLHLLDKLSNLEILEMACPNEDDDIESLAVSKGDNVLLPRLRKCTFECHADDFDALNGPINKLIAARCKLSAKESGAEGLTTMELTFSNSIRYVGLKNRMMPGFADGQYGYLGIQPTRLESWYGDRTVQRSSYTEAAATIPQVLYTINSRDINIDTFKYRHTLELITKVEQKYKAEELVDFLEANTNIWMISTAYALKTRLPDNKDKSAQYRRVIRLLQKVKRDLTGRLDDFHWIWETSLEKVWIRYIPDDHEMRSDPDKFANAVLGITDDPWIIEDMRTL